MLWLGPIPALSLPTQPPWQPLPLLPTVLPGMRAGSSLVHRLNGGRGCGRRQVAGPCPRLHSCPHLEGRRLWSQVTRPCELTSPSLSSGTSKMTAMAELPRNEQDKRLRRPLSGTAPGTQSPPSVTRNCPNTHTRQPWPSRGPALHSQEQLEAA